METIFNYLCLFKYVQIICQGTKLNLEINVDLN